MHNADYISMPTVSVIITSYGDCRPLSRAIESVLEQSYHNIEIIVVDDNGVGTDYNLQTKEAVAEYVKGQRITYIEHEMNKNGSAARNTGLRHAKGDYIAFLDNDDIYLPHKVECSVKELERDSRYDASFDDVLLVSNGRLSGVVRLNQKDLNQRAMLINENLIGSGSNIFLRRSAVEEIGFFDESFIRNQDVEYMIRLFRSHAAIATQKIGIVKTKDGNDNVPSYHKMKSVKKLLHTTFANDYASLTEEDYESAMQNDAEVLLGIAIASGSIKNVCDAENAMSTKSPNQILSNRLKMVRRKLRGIKVLKSKWDSIQHRRVRNRLTDEWKYLSPALERWELLKE